MSYESWRITYQDSEQAARAAYKTLMATYTKLTNAEAKLVQQEQLLAMTNENFWREFHLKEEVQAKLTEARTALQAIAAYPSSPDKELGYVGCRQIARTVLNVIDQSMESE